MISDKKSVRFLYKYCLDLGIVDWIISPGSRNAPITQTIANSSDFKASPVVDERSAAFIALGKAITTGRPVAITCTSGSASLNYAPAISEAYYQKIPLLIVTADRPRKWIDNGEGQAIDQVDVYKNYTIASFHLNEEEEDQMIINTLNEITQYLFGKNKGPVHLNLAFEEPLYGVSEEGEVDFSFNLPTIAEEVCDIDKLIKNYQSKHRIMILVGQMDKNETLSYLLSELLIDKRVVVLTETNANICNFNFVNCIDRTLPPISEEKFHPDLVITLGGAIVSKRIKKYLRSIKGLEHWHISSSDSFPNTFEALTECIKQDPDKVIRSLVKVSGGKEVCDFQVNWLQRSFSNQEKHFNFLKSIKWCDLQVHAIIYDWLPDHITLHQGNSSIVRYFQLFDPIDNVTYRSNRGVSGIDGCVSTALGASVVNDKPHVLVVGDLSFVYDINAWWNGLDKSNLLVIIINNGGGGIFKIIEGPSETGVLDEFFKVRSTANISQLVNAHGMDYSLIEDATSLESKLKEVITLYARGDFKGSVLEVDTKESDSAGILKDYFKKVNPQ